MAENKSTEALLEDLRSAASVKEYELADDTYNDPAQATGVDPGPHTITLPEPVTPPRKRKRI